MNRAVVLAILDELSPDVRAELRGIRILLKPHADTVDVARGAGEKVAYFWGSRPVDDVGDGRALPSSDGPRGEIVLFLDKVAAREFRRTLLHEIGHALGYDEDDLHAMGLG